MKRACVLLAVAVLVAVPAVVMADWTEDFTASDALGAGRGTNYVPGTNWAINFGYALIQNTGGNSSGYVKTNWDDGSDPGPGGILSGEDWFSPANLIKHSSTDGAGTYVATEVWVRGREIFGYQDPNNYMFVLAGGSYYYYSAAADGIPLGEPGNCTVVYGIRYNGNDHYLMGSATNWSTFVNITAVWRPADNQVDVTVVDKNGATIADWTNLSDYNKFESGQSAFSPSLEGNSVTYLGGASFTAAAIPEPATMTLLVLGGLGALARRRNK